ncbi:MAG: hypothetical protein RI907_1229 [Pseudomonadota bacterium]|jgi:lipopolysaccharide export LptBFGC system permease protein LptF
MRPYTLAIAFAAVALYAVTQVAPWSEKKTQEAAATARNCEAAKPFTQGGGAESISEQQRAMMAAAKCAYGSINPVGAAVMKQQGVDPQQAIDLFGKLEQQIPKD